MQLEESTVMAEGGSALGLSMPHNSTHVINVYQNYSEIKDQVPQAPNSKPPVREAGDIKEFSKKSRLRMMKRILSIKYDDDKNPIFITLTYHKRTDKKAREYKLDIAKFTRFLNRYDCDCRWVWKMEFQKRGAIHYHIIYFPERPHSYNMILSLRQKVSEYWHRYAEECHDDHRKYGTNVQHVKSQRMMIGYTVKYVTKEDEGKPPPGMGRYWACSANFQPEEIVSFEITTRSFYQLRRFIRRWVKSRKRKKTAFYKRTRCMASISAFMPHAEFCRLISFVAGVDPGGFQLLIDEFGG